jgi:N-acyl-D-aspartate/D-glutamate deacylase
MIPPWGLEGGVDKTLERCKDPELRKRFRSEHVPQWKLFGIPKDTYPEYPEGLSPAWERIVLKESEAFQEYLGITFEEIGIAMGKDPWDAALDILVAHGEKTGHLDVSVFAASTNVKDSVIAMKHPLASFESDRGIHAPYGPLHKEKAPPNSYGAFARVFRKYVRERGYITLEDAVRKMTSAPCLVLGLRNRGMIREGMWADVVVLNPDRVQDRATLEDPAQYPTGIYYVLVNGEVVIDNGEHTGALPGKIIRKHLE